jgi:molybdopterin/thiamine biosynthesis adenylyltransferase
LDTIHTDSPTSITIKGKAIPGAEDRQKKIPGFDQEVFSRRKVLCIGAGGLISHIAPALVRKGIGALTILDDDVVEVSNLNRQRFYERDIGKNKAIALVENLQGECIFETQLTGHALRFEEALATGVDLNCNVAVCGVDNNPTRTAASQYFRGQNTPLIFTAVSAAADHGYTFVQERSGACFGCTFPDAINDSSFPCPGSPAIVEILQAVGALAIYAIDSCLMGRPRSWNYRNIHLSNSSWDSCQYFRPRSECLMACVNHIT